MNVRVSAIVSVSATVCISRFNVFLRDKFSCQYCGSKKDLTFDHLLPRAHGGETTWENIVTACSMCNVKKGGKLLKHSGMKPKNYPKVPTMADLDKCGRSFPPNFLHESWMDFLYWIKYDFANVFFFSFHFFFSLKFPILQINERQFSQQCI